MISYVRQSFGNNLPMIQPAQVARRSRPDPGPRRLHMVEIMKERRSGWEQWVGWPVRKDNPLRVKAAPAPW